MKNRSLAAQNLAARLLAGPWTQEALADGLASVLGHTHHRTRRALCTRLASLGDGAYLPAPHELTRYLCESPFFRPPLQKHVSVVLDPPRFSPAPPFAALPLPALTTPGDLAAWLLLSAEQLDWLADERRTHDRAARQPLQHYRYAFLDKRTGPPRLLEAPKPRLKAIQRRILHEILSLVPVHDCAKGFVSGRSCLDGAQLHAGEAMVVTFDLAQFFPSLSRARVHGLFRTLGYPWAVARSLAGLCTTITPTSVGLRLPSAAGRPSQPIQALYSTPHLPQGAPTSPALANLLAWRLDLRLHGLARAADANYSRYADDLAFSGGGDFARRPGVFQSAVETIVIEEGFGLNPAKTRFMPRSKRQNITGITVNAHCNVARSDYDRLKAILHNCLRQNPASQNLENSPDFKRHLDGRIVWVEQINPHRGAKLRRQFEAIDWACASAT